VPGSTISGVMDGKLAGALVEVARIEDRTPSQVVNAAVRPYIRLPARARQERRCSTGRVVDGASRWLWQRAGQRPDVPVEEESNPHLAHQPVPQRRPIPDGDPPHPARPQSCRRARQLATVDPNRLIVALPVANQSHCGTNGRGT
jgi:hypothetical protein